MTLIVMELLVVVKGGNVKQQGCCALGISWDWESLVMVVIGAVSESE